MSKTAGHNIDGQTRLVGVIGWPVAHSLSPAMHNAVLRDLALNWCYVAMPVRPGSVEGGVRGAAALGFRGFNVTVPHKRAVIPLLDAAAPEAAALGAVNTVVIKRDQDERPYLAGYNTDVAGFLGSLRVGGFDPASGGSAVVVGAGGAARAVVYGLIGAGMTRVTVLNRTPSRAEHLVEDMIEAGLPADRLSCEPLTDGNLVATARRAVLVVNATTVGMWPETEGSVWPQDVAVPSHLAVYDLVYNPLETKLLAQARGGGARAIDGLGMLARQGALALDLWMDQPLDVEVITAQMRRACERVLFEDVNEEENDGERF